MGLILALTPPLDPSAAEARRLLLLELSKPEYQAGRETLAEMIMRWIQAWLASLMLQFNPGSGSGALGPILLVVIVAALAIVALLVFGRPRLRRRSADAGALFGEDDRRDSAALREAALLAADAGDYALAIEEGFRAIARGLAERSIVSTFPGTTAASFARSAGDALPELAARFQAAGTVFDGVRYLDHPGTATGWEQVRDLERDARAAKPRLVTTSA
ncbi:DUF4129 domain-containing protein [Galbitalea soli]|uniref:DUF4129 domain-containing protein n=1 Tax=Galbitalea soli TaxID=1268042 RepID=A0A7C9PML1_9MICO|nr:DUF4129 domain-containing protein [Galbitalea soli]NEM90828.1 DUF4129 domain-containing protein [Galbitalea soli]NYJ31548.1 hypothetical protein [Galbitalea soli]